MGANISTCCTDATTTTARRVGGGSSSSSGSDSEEHSSSTDTDGSGRTTLDNNNNNNAQQTFHYHHLSNRTQKHTSGHHHTTTGATRHPQQQHNSVSPGSDTANPSIAFPTLVLEQQTQFAQTTQHRNAATSSERIPQQQQQPLHTTARNPLFAPVLTTSSTTPFPSPSDCLVAYEAAASEDDVISQRRGTMIGVVDMIGGAPSEFEDAFRPRDTTTPLSHGIQRACSDNSTSSSLHHHHQQQSSSPRQQEFGPTVTHVAGNGGVPAAHLAAEKTVATVVPPSSLSNSTTGHHGVKNRIEGSAGLSSDSQLVITSRNERSISSNLPSGALENEPSEPPTVFAQQQYRTARIAANMQQHSAGTIVNSSSTTVPGGTDDDLILSPASQASTRASTLTQQLANGAVDEEQLHVLSPAAATEQTIVVVKRHHSAPIVSTTTAIHSQGEGVGQGHHTNTLSPGVAPPLPLPQHLPLTLFDSLRSTPRGTATMVQKPSEQTVPQLVVEVASEGQWGGDRNGAAATSLRHPSTASGSGRSASLYHQVRQQRQQQSAGSDGGGGSGGGGWSSRDSSPLSSVSSVSSLGSGSAARGNDGERRRRRRRGSSLRSSQDVASASSSVSAGQIRRASRPQRSHNPLAEAETELPHEGAHIIGSGQAGAEILPTTSGNILRDEVERFIGDDRALLTILSQGSLQKLTPTANAANTAQQEGHRQQPSIFASDGRYQQPTMTAAAPTAAQFPNNNSSTNISSGSATHRSSGSGADAINNSSLGVQGLAPYVYSSWMDGGQAPAGTGGGAEDPYRRQSSLQASSIASVGGLVTVPSGANASLFSSEGGASLQTPGGYLHQSRLLSGNASGSVGGRSPGGVFGASSNSNSQHPLLGGISTSFQTGESLGGGGAASPSYASDPQLFPSSGAPTTGRASSWGLGASGIESTSGYAGGALEEASGQSGPLLRLHWTNSLLMRMAQGRGEGASSLPASGMATPVACSS
ncbi:Hypothetical protein, putative [Bodo saltans]|uniref:Uncharacterized protein n=1 Tax=Bodo saltans TaxID=75058 RepID=A0A0S4JPY3_BODSA|nr:Hypothetical protein, putative [Bodo saltans]|eukprot:CUG93607.1 Hypothetical protein, putative [Bodo saltans]